MTATATSAYALDDATLDLLFREARTANTFTDEPVSREQLEAIYELVKLGPTALNSQPMRIVFLTDDAAKARLVPHMGGSNQEKTAKAPAVAILAADGDFHENLPEVFPHAPDAKSWFPDAEARHDMASFNTGLQTGYFVQAVRAVGLAAGPMSGFDKAAVDAEFFAGTALRSQVVVNIGRPGENAWLDRLPRLSWDQAVTVL